MNGIVKKIDTRIAELVKIVETTKGEPCVTATARANELFAFKKIILAEQKEPSWKQAIRERQITIIDDHCVCGMAIDNDWEFCPKCGRQIMGRGYSIPINRPLTKGDVIRESNESLANEMAIIGCCGCMCTQGKSVYPCVGECNENILDYLNQPYKDGE